VDGLIHYKYTLPLEQESGFPGIKYVLFLKRQIEMHDHDTNSELLKSTVDVGIINFTETFKVLYKLRSEFRRIATSRDLQKTA